MKSQLGKDNNLTNISNINQISQISTFSKNVTVQILDIDLADFKELVIKSVAYCICPSLEQDIIYFYNPKPISMINYIKPGKDIHNHPENTELPKFSKDKEYCLVLDMDETLIHFFDVSL
jgi:hypothetical protein